MNFKVLPRVRLHNGLQEAPAADDTFYLLRLAGLRSGKLPTLLEGNSTPGGVVRGSAQGWVTKAASRNFPNFGFRQMPASARYFGRRNI